MGMGRWWGRRRGMRWQIKAWLEVGMGIGKRVIVDKKIEGLYTYCSNCGEVMG
jgi:hypothetical protein